LPIDDSTRSTLHKLRREAAKATILSKFIKNKHLVRVKVTTTDKKRLLSPTRNKAEDPEKSAIPSKKKAIETIVIEDNEDKAKDIASDVKEGEQPADSVQANKKEDKLGSPKNTSLDTSDLIRIKWKRKISGLLASCSKIDAKEVEAELNVNEDVDETKLMETEKVKLVDDNKDGKKTHSQVKEDGTEKGAHKEKKEEPAKSKSAEHEDIPIVKENKVMDNLKPSDDDLPKKLATIDKKSLKEISLKEPEVEGIKTRNKSVHLGKKKMKKLRNRAGTDLKEVKAKKITGKQRDLMVRKKFKNLRSALNDGKEVGTKPGTRQSDQLKKHKIKNLAIGIKGVKEARAKAGTGSSSDQVAKKTPKFLASNAPPPKEVGTQTETSNKGAKKNLKTPEDEVPKESKDIGTKTNSSDQGDVLQKKKSKNLADISPEGPNEVSTMTETINTDYQPVKRKRGRKKKSETIAKVSEKTLESSNDEFTPTKRTRKLPKRFLTEVVDLPGALDMRRMSSDGTKVVSEAEGSKKKIKHAKEEMVEKTNLTQSLEALSSAVLSKYNRKQLTPSTLLKKNTKKPSEGTVKKITITTEILNKMQAEYAVSALYNYRHESEGGSTAEGGSICEGGSIDGGDSFEGQKEDKKQQEPGLIFF